MTNAWYRSAALVAGLLLFLPGCPTETKNCTAILLFGLRVSVAGGASAMIFPSTVIRCADCLGLARFARTRAPRSYMEELQCSAMGTTCACSGAGERRGKYLVTVMTGSDVVGQRDVVVTADECHVKPVAVSFTVP